MALSEKIFTTTFPEPPSAATLMKTRSDMEPAKLHAENHHWFVSEPAELLVTMAAFTARRMRDGSRDMSAMGIYCLKAVERARHAPNIVDQKAGGEMRTRFTRCNKIVPS